MTTLIIIFERDFSCHFDYNYINILYFYYNYSNIGWSNSKTSNYQNSSSIKLTIAKDTCRKSRQIREKKKSQKKIHQAITNK